MTREEELDLAVAKIRLVLAEHRVSLQSGDGWSAVFVALDEEPDSGVRL